jgi:hypothetical protein
MNIRYKIGARYVTRSASCSELGADDGLAQHIGVGYVGVGYVKRSASCSELDAHDGLARHTGIGYYGFRYYVVGYY